MLDKEFRKQRAQTARELAAIANDPFTKKRLLDLAARYEDNRSPATVKSTLLIEVTAWGRNGNF
jgi:hypothetical protein